MPLTRRPHVNGHLHTNNFGGKVAIVTGGKCVVLIPFFLPNRPKSTRRQHGIGYGTISRHHAISRSKMRKDEARSFGTYFGSLRVASWKSSWGGSLRHCRWVPVNRLAYQTISQEFSRSITLPGEARKALSNRKIEGWVAT